MVTAGALILASAEASAQLNMNAISPNDLRELGRELLAEAVAQGGRDLNPEWRRDVALVIDSLTIASAYRAHPVIWDIVSDSSLNAGAGPGGVMLVHVGLPIFCTEFGAARARGNAAVARREYLGCLASVIGHEFGHLALGHSDSIATMRQRRQTIAERERQATSLRTALRDSLLLRALQFERKTELEADEAGALYMLRAGWEVQTAINLFVAMDSVERQSSDWRGQLTWLRGHPRAVERAALLEAHRARLKLNQRDFDDALALIDHDVMPDSALALINRVLKDLPYLPAARHARAVVLARKWLESAAASDLEVRPTMAAYDAEFMSSIKGGDATALRDARAAFGETLSAYAHPYTLANLAVLDAYAGDVTLALQRAELAVQRMPDDAEVLNNLGVVLYRARRFADAKRAFEQAEELLGERLTPAVAYNVARATLAAGDTAAARPLIERYVRHDQTSAWGREAVVMREQVSRGLGPAALTRLKPTPPPATRSPQIAGIRLGMPASQVLRVLGRPDVRERDEGRVGWHYAGRGLLLVIHPTVGVVVIQLSTREAGEIAGVRVGDALPQALRVLGPESEREGAGDSGEMLKFVRGNWLIWIGARDGVVRAVGLSLESV